MPLTTDSTWRGEAACRGLDTGIFFPATDEEAEPAKVICESCPVREACLGYAIASRQEDGVWGGLTEVERRKLRRRLAESARRASTNPGRFTPPGPRSETYPPTGQTRSRLGACAPAPWRVGGPCRPAGLATAATTGRRRAPKAQLSDRR